MLALTAERAGLADGQDILDLGCGWGSFALWAAERYPQSRVVAMSNSREQRRFIEGLQRERGLDEPGGADGRGGGFHPVTALRPGGIGGDVRARAKPGRTDAAPGGLAEARRGWCSSTSSAIAVILYLFDPAGPGGWMARHFFSGGMMPSFDHLPRCQDDLELVERWEVDGGHYARTLRAWLDNLDRRRDAVMPLLRADVRAPGCPSVACLLAGLLHVVRGDLRLGGRQGVLRGPLRLRTPRDQPRRSGYSVALRRPHQEALAGQLFGAAPTSAAVTPARAGLWTSSTVSRRESGRSQQAAERRPELPVRARKGGLQSVVPAACGSGWRSAFFTHTP